MRKSLFLFLTFYFTISAFGAPYKISVCAIFKNEGPYLKEWIDYHLGIGIDHFYLYNNDSTDDFLSVLDPYIKKGIVHVIPWPNLWKEIYFGFACQPFAYQHCIENRREETEWFCFIDLDEFIVPMKEYNLKKCLQKHYAKAEAIWMHWRCFGTSFITLTPQDSILTHLLLCSKKENPWNGLGKTMVRSDAVKGIAQDHTNPHLVDLKYGSYWNGSGTQGLSFNHLDKYIRVNHYVFRDEGYFYAQKLHRYQEYGIEGYDWITTKENLIQRNIDFCQDVDIRIHELIR